MPLAGWILNLGDAATPADNSAPKILRRRLMPMLMMQRRGGYIAARPVITIEGQIITTRTRGLTVDSTRKILATLTPGDAAVVYTFEETEVS